MADVDELIIRVSLNTKGTKKGFNKVKADANIVAKDLGKNFGGGFSKAFLASIGKLGGLLAVGLGIRKVATSFLDLETSIAEVNTIATDLTKTNAELAKEFLNLSSEFGGTAAAQAKSFYQIISAGITDAAAANELLIASNKLAIGGLTTQAAAIDILTTAVNAFEGANLNGSKTADILFTTVKLGKTTVDELASSLGKVLTPANALGITLEEVAAAIAALTVKGIGTAEAVTGLKAVFTSFIANQKIAQEISIDVGKAFSLQSLKTKGLSKFLKDLTKSLGGSTEQLKKVLGSSEAVTAVLALQSGQFATLDKNLVALANSTGAADEAFKRMQRTVGQQLNKAFSTLTAIFTNLAGRSGDFLVKALISLNKNLRFILLNIDQIIDVFLRFGRVLIATAIILNRKLILSTVIDSFKKLRRTVFTTATTFRVNFSAGLLLGQSRLKAFTGALKATRIGLKLLTTAAKVAKAVLTFGLLFAVDELITRFITLRDQGASLANVFTLIGNAIKVSVLTALRDIIGLLAFEFPLLLDTLGVDAPKVFEALSKEISKTKVETKALVAAFSTVKGAGAAIAEEFTITGQAINEQSLQIFDTLTNTFVGFTKLIIETFSSFADVVSDVNTFTKAQLQDLANGFGQAFAAGITRAVSSVVTAVQQGQNAFEALGKSILGIIGDLAIFVGQFVVAVGIAKIALNALPGGAAIAAGLGLIAVGTILKTLAGSPVTGGGTGAASVGSGGGAGATIEPPQTSLEPDAELERITAVTVNIEGTVLDPIAVGQQIAEILDETFNAGASTIQVNTA